MKRNFLSIATVLALVFSLSSFTSIAPEANTWEVDQGHSSVSFSVNHFFSPVIGRFNDFTTSLNFDPSDLEESEVSFTVQIASVNTQDQKRDKHLQSKDFFNAEEFPQMSFKSSKFEKVDDKNYNVTGNLTIRDVSKEVTIPLQVLALQEHPKKKSKMIAALKAQFKINRSEYGVGTRSWAAATVVGNEVDVTVLVEATRKK
jgi:polyisoprenoid-binding protein YceI